ncbi:protein LIAT1 [Antennarius striatus]|uniref:protein LIAT1 n=1 Tax=Antennarius striatus TaxID=241820 RepID=UPI0035B071A5
METRQRTKRKYGVVFLSGPRVRGLFHIDTAEHDDVMPEEKNREPLHPIGSSDKKSTKKKKRRKKRLTDSTTPPENTEKPQVASMPPETQPKSLLPPVSSAQPRVQLPKPRPASLKDGECLTRSGRRSKKHSKDSLPPPTATSKSMVAETPFQGYVKNLTPQARESLRWEGVLEDPQAEEKRLELYRTSRRQRYISQREALLKQSQCVS